MKLRGVYELHNYVNVKVEPEGGGGLFSKNLGGGVRHASRSPYPILEQNMSFFLAYFRPDPKSIHYFRPKRLENHTLWGRTCLL